MTKRRLKRQPRKLCIDVVETQAIVLVDKYGTQRATVSCYAGDGGKGSCTVIQINDDNGRPRLELQVDPHGNPSIRLSNPNDGAGISMAVSDGNGNGLSIGDFEGKPCIMMGIPHPDSNDPRGPHPDITVLDELSHRGWTAFSGEYISPASEKSADNISIT